MTLARRNPSRPSRVGRNRKVRLVTDPFPFENTLPSTIIEKSPANRQTALPFTTVQFACGHVEYGGKHIAPIVAGPENRACLIESNTHRPSIAFDYTILVIRSFISRLLRRSFKAYFQRFASGHVVYLKNTTIVSDGDEVVIRWMKATAEILRARGVFDHTHTFPFGNLPYANAGITTGSDQKIIDGRPLEIWWRWTKNGNDRIDFERRDKPLMVAVWPFSR